ncbi:MAG: FHA domain-containing protein [Beutenbergiaceae bacterium]
MRYRPGKGIGIIRGDLAALLRFDAPSELIDELWTIAGENGDFARVLSAILAQGFDAVGDFALLHRDQGRPTIILRGDVQADDGGEQWSGAGEYPWRHIAVGDSQNIRLSLSTNTSDEVELPLLTGVVHTSSITLANIGEPPLTAPAPAASAQSAAVKHHPNGTATAPPAVAQVAKAPAGPQAATEPSATLHPPPRTAPAPQPASPPPSTPQPASAMAAEPESAAPIPGPPVPGYPTSVTSVPSTPAPAGTGAPAADSMPTDSEPADSEPADSKPADSKPADSEPVDSGPVDSGPAHPVPAPPDPVPAPTNSTPAMVSAHAMPAPSGPAPAVGPSPAHSAPIPTGPMPTAQVPAPAGPPTAVEDSTILMSTPLLQQVLAEAEQAPQYRLRLITGDLVPLDRPVLVGRAPHHAATDPKSGPPPRLVVVPSPQGDISRTHARVEVSQNTVLVTDLDSTNGMQVRSDFRPPQRLHPGVPTRVDVGSVIDLGDGITLTIEVSQ